MAVPASACLVEHFAALEDPRQSWKVLYPLPEVLLLVLCDTLAGAEDFVEPALGPGQSGLPAPRPALLGRHPEPRHAERRGQCHRRRAARAVLQRLGRESARQGSRPSRSRGRRHRWQELAPYPRPRKERGPLYMVSAWVSSQRPSGGGATGGGCQTRVAQVVHDRGGDYLLAIKDNQPSLHDEVRRLFNDPATKLHSCFETTDGDHGRIELRRHQVSHDVAWLTTDRRFPGEPRFPDIRAIAMVEAEVERGSSTRRERRSYLSSLPLDAKLFARAVRCHWHVENRLHWVLDVVFHEDLSRLRSGSGPQNMAIVRHMALNLLRGARDKHSLKVRRKSAAWDTAYLEALLQQSA